MTDAEAGEVRDKARTHAFDWYLAALRAPRAASADLLALAAFRGEISRVPLEIGDTALAEIKLQWWRDAISQGVYGARSGNPIADALLDLVARRNLPHAELLRFIDGIARELYEDGIEDDAALAAYADETEGALGKLASLCVVAETPSDMTKSFENACAEALALTRLARTLPIHISRGRVPVPRTWLNEFGDPRGGDEVSARSSAALIQRRLFEGAHAALARARLSQRAVPSNNFAAFLAIVLVEPYLRRLDRPGHDALREIVDISPLTRVTKLLIASLRAKI